MVVHECSISVLWCDGGMSEKDVKDTSGRKESMDNRCRHDTLHQNESRHTDRHSYMSCHLQEGTEEELSLEGKEQRPSQCLQI